MEGPSGKRGGLLLPWVINVLQKKRKRKGRKSTNQRLVKSIKKKIEKRKKEQGNKGRFYALKKQGI